MKIVFPIIMIWTLVVIILHFCGVGAFANWPVIAGPFTWSCCFVFIWDMILTIALLTFVLIIKLICTSSR